MDVATFTLITLFSYLAALKLISIFAYKKSVNTTEDYFLASRGVGTFALVATTIASIFSTGTVVSAPAEFFVKGGKYFWFFWYTFLPITMAVFALRFWKLGKTKNFVTPGEMLGDFHKSQRVHAITAFIGLFALIPYAVAQLVAIGKTFEALTSGTITYSIAIIIVCAAMGLYLYYGGSRAVIWTDMIQGIIFCCLLLTSAGLILYWAGGWENITQNLLKNHPTKAVVKGVKFSYFEMFILSPTFLFLPHVWQRCYMAKSARILAKNIAIIPFVIFILFLAGWTIGTSGLVFFPDGLADGDSLLGAIFENKAPYFGALVLVAAFAAGMSTIDSQLLSSGSIITRDVRPLLGDRTGKMLDYQFARLVTVILLAIAFLWSLTLQSASIMSLIILGISINVVFVPTLIGMFFWRKSTETGAFWSMTIGLIVFCVKQFSSLGDYFPTELGGITWALIVSTLIYIIPSFLGQASELEDKRKEYQQILS